MNSSELSVLIIKYISGDLTNPQEISLFQAWLHEDASHLAMIEELKHVANISDDLNFLDRLNTELAWKKVQMRATPESTHKVLRPSIALWNKVAVVTGGVLLSIMSIYLYQSASQHPIDQASSQMGIPGVHIIQDATPAVNAAQLILDNGEVITLTNQQAEVTDGMLHIDNKIQDLSHAKDGLVFQHKLIVPIASYYHIALEDGTKVWLNSNSELEFPSRFATNERRVTLLKGEAFFDVAADKNKPFYVESKGVDIKVLGTEFNVNSYRKQPKTTLVEGRLHLSAGNSGVVLEPGSRADLVNSQITVRRAEVTKEVAWKDGVFHFQKDNIAYIAEQLQLWYGVEVVFAGTVNLERQYSGIISRGSKLSEVLAILNHASGLEFRLDKGKLTVFNA